MTQAWQYRLSQDRWQQVQLSAVSVPVGAGVPPDHQASVLEDPGEGVCLAGLGVDGSGLDAQLVEEVRGYLAGRGVSRRP